MYTQATNFLLYFKKDRKKKREKKQRKVLQFYKIKFALTPYLAILILGVYLSELKIVHPKRCIYECL